MAVAAPTTVPITVQARPAVTSAASRKPATCNPPEIAWHSCDVSELQRILQQAQLR